MHYTFCLVYTKKSLVRQTWRGGCELLLTQNFGPVVCELKQDWRFDFSNRHYWRTKFSSKYPFTVRFHLLFKFKLHLSLFLSLFWTSSLNFLDYSIHKLAYFSIVLVKTRYLSVVLESSFAPLLFSLLYSSSYPPTAVAVPMLPSKIPLLTTLVLILTDVIFCHPLQIKQKNILLLELGMKQVLRSISSAVQTVGMDLATISDVGLPLTAKVSRNPEIIIYFFPRGFVRPLYIIPKRNSKQNSTYRFTCTRN